MSLQLQELMQMNFGKERKKWRIVFVIFLIIGLLIVGGGLGMAIANELLREPGALLSAQAKIMFLYEPLLSVGSLLIGVGLFFLILATVTILDQSEKIDKNEQIVLAEKRQRELEARPKNILEMIIARKNADIDQERERTGTAPGAPSIAINNGAGPSST